MHLVGGAKLTLMAEGVEMGAARPPYPAPDGAAVWLGKRLLALNEAL